MRASGGVKAGGLDGLTLFLYVGHPYIHPGPWWAASADSRRRRSTWRRSCTANSSPSGGSSRRIPRSAVCGAATGAKGRSSWVNDKRCNQSTHPSISQAINQSTHPSINPVSPQAEDDLIWPALREKAWRDGVARESLECALEEDHSDEECTYLFVCSGQVVAFV